MDNQGGFETRPYEMPHESFVALGFLQSLPWARSEMTDGTNES
jgi:hypothetical protein